MFLNLCPKTLAHHRSFKHYTAALKAGGTTYQWGFPLQILVQVNGKCLGASDGEQMENILYNLEIIIPEFTPRDGLSPFPPQYG